MQFLAKNLPNNGLNPPSAHGLAPLPIWEILDPPIRERKKLPNLCGMLAFWSKEIENMPMQQHRWVTFWSSHPEYSNGWLVLMRNEPSFGKLGGFHPSPHTHITQESVGAPGRDPYRTHVLPNIFYSSWIRAMHRGGFQWAVCKLSISEEFPSPYLWRHFMQPEKWMSSLWKSTCYILNIFHASHKEHFETFYFTSFICA